MAVGEKEPATEPKPVTYAPTQSFSYASYVTSQVSLSSVTSYVPVMDVSLTVTAPSRLHGTCAADCSGLVLATC